MKNEFTKSIVFKNGKRYLPARFEQAVLNCKSESEQNLAHHLDCVELKFRHYLANESNDFKEVDNEIIAAFEVNGLIIAEIGEVIFRVGVELYNNEVYEVINKYDAAMLKIQKLMVRATHRFTRKDTNNFAI